jgi:hypothetical protein
VARFILAFYLVIESRGSAEAISVGTMALPRGVYPELSGDSSPLAQNDKSEGLRMSGKAKVSQRQYFSLIDLFNVANYTFLTM